MQIPFLLHENGTSQSWFSRNTSLKTFSFLKMTFISYVCRF